MLRTVVTSNAVREHMIHRRECASRCGKRLEAAIYARVSTFDQEPENQLQEAMRHHADQYVVIIDGSFPYRSNQAVV
jgi:uncharacterized iron-regulated protein